ncbi:MAG: DUF1566 domain-containing protein [Myxococcota bacterium]|nr:DUF1566 domain-containing protein [Myxococcota bacterium]
MSPRKSSWLGGAALASVLGAPDPAMADWASESWGVMLWGQAASVPALGWLGLLVLALTLSAAAVWTLRKRRPGLGLPLQLVLLAVPLAVASATVTLPNAFSNGTVADANEVNANFAAVKSAVDDNDSRITVLEGGAPAVRFEDCGDGTVADHDTGLLWEQKTGTPAASVECSVTICTDPHDVNNIYAWSITGTAPDGGVHLDFLARLNGDHDPVAANGCFANDCGWRLPKIAEFQTILVGTASAPGQSGSCDAPPCIDQAFAALGSPTASSDHWSASSVPSFPGVAWLASLGGGLVYGDGKAFAHSVRAVRAGSCR